MNKNQLKLGQPVVISSERRSAILSPCKLQIREGIVYELGLSRYRSLSLIQGDQKILMTSDSGTIKHQFGPIKILINLKSSPNCDCCLYARP